MNMHFSKKAQVEVTFNWVYVLIAGAVIILFFVGIAAKQKTSSEKTLSGDIVRIMESIFASAGASEKTKNIIDISGLADYTFQFSCHDGVSEFNLKETESQRRQNAIDPVFSPAEIRATQLILWSLPYQLPFKITDFLFIGSSSTKYVVLGDRDGFAEELMSETNEFNREQVTSLSEVDPGKNFQVHVLDLSGDFYTRIPNDAIPIENPSLEKMDDDKVTAVSFLSANQIQYYRKQGTVFVREHQNPVDILSLEGEKDAARYAAIFATTAEIYKCNMQKALERLRKIIAVYQKKEEALNMYYQRRQDQGEAVGQCLGFLRLNVGEDIQNIQNQLFRLDGEAQSCLVFFKNNLPAACNGLIAEATHLRETNHALFEECGGSLY